MKCPSLDHLTDYLRGLVVGTERAQIQQHLTTGCSSCLHNQQWLLEVKRIAPLDDSFEFPEALTAHIISWMPAKPARTPLRTLIAQLLFDSFAPPALAGARATTMTNPSPDAFAGRQLLYQVEGFDVDLRIEKADNAKSFELMGQVLQQDAAVADLSGRMVHLWLDENRPVTTSTDGEGMFRFSQLPPEIYELRIVLPEGIIEIPEVSVGEV